MEFLMSFFIEDQLLRWFFSNWAALALTSSLVSFSSSSEFFSYTKPLESISGCARSAPVCLLSVMTTVNIPSSESSFLSLSTTLPMSPTPLPSTITLPAVTLQCAFISEIFGGSVLVEQVFSYPGLGQAAVTAGLGGDVALLAGIALVSAALVFGGNLLANILYGVLDPRMRIGEGRA